LLAFIFAKEKVTERERGGREGKKGRFLGLGIGTYKGVPEEQRAVVGG